MTYRLIITDRCLYDIDDSLEGIDQVIVRESLINQLAPLMNKQGGTLINLSCSTIEHMAFTHQLNRKLSQAFEECGGQLDRFFFHHDPDPSERLAHCLGQITHHGPRSRHEESVDLILIDDRAETVSTCGLDDDEPLVCVVIADPDEPEALQQALADQGLPA